MKHRFTFLGLLSLIAVSCTYEESFVPEEDNDSSSVEFYATIDEQPDANTKVYADDQLRVLWNADDRITIFNKNTYNQQYRFTGVDGDNAGGYRIVKSDDEFITSNPLDNIYAVYPYRETNKISNSGIVTTSIPSEQTYKANSFGIGANTMVSVAESNMLKFKNIGGYMSLKFYGEGVSVSSITLKSNNGEFIAGDCTVDMSSGLPVSNLITANASDAITMVCDPPIELPAEKTDAVMAIFVLSPGTLTGGITVTVTTSDGGVFEKTTSNKLEIGRSAITRLGALDVVPEYVQPNNVIYYTSTDGEIVTPYATDVFGANILSNTYENGQGVITFDNRITSIGESAFRECKTLKTISIPEGVTYLGSYSFYQCVNLSSISFPSSLTGIGYYAFGSCHSLSIVSLPESVNQIGARAFHFCDRLVSINIPEGVSIINSFSFYMCSNLPTITFPSTIVSIKSAAFGGCNGDIIIKAMTPPLLDGVNFWGSGYIYVPAESVEAYKLAWSEFADRIQAIPQPNNEIWYTTIAGYTVSPYKTGISTFGADIVSNTYENGRGVIRFSSDINRIGRDAFNQKYELASISIPNSVTSIDEGAFTTCTYLEVVDLPESVTTIGDHAFCNCTRLTTINIPNSVTSIGFEAFGYCYSLVSLTIPESVSSIGTYAFCNCNSLKRVTFLNPTPVYSNDIFDETDNCSIFVPSSSISGYRSANGWVGYSKRIYAIPEYVDLGLSVKWATFNIGASSPEEYGDYFAWGEIEPYYISKDPLSWRQGKGAGYAWESYKFNPSGDGRTFTKYTGSDFDTLLREDDAATANWGESWRMPTYSDWEALLNTDNFNWVWTDDYKGTGVAGRIVTSKIRGYEGNSIFLPAAGVRADTSLGFGGTHGWYWSSTHSGPTLYESYIAWGAYFSPNIIDDNIGDRYDGQTIRPVIEKED